MKNFRKPAMKALVNTKYGNHEVLEYKDVEKPAPKKNEVLIKVHSVSLNSSDMENLTGHPGYIRIFGPFKPAIHILGSDISGIVEAVGKKVSKFQVGDKVVVDLLMICGGLAEYVCAPEKRIHKKLVGMSFEIASTILQAADVAFQGINTKGRVKQGQKVLIIGAGGGSGSFAIQLAKHYGAEVTGVDNGSKLDLMKSLGADHVIDYTQVDCTKTKERYDLILDLVAAHPLLQYKSALNPGGKYFIVGGKLSRIFKTLIFGPILSLFSKKKMGMLFVKTSKYLDDIVTLVKNGIIKPSIKHKFDLKDAAEGFRLLIEGQSKGKIVITVVKSR